MSVAAMAIAFSRLRDAITEPPLSLGLGREEPWTAVANHQPAALWPPAAWEAEAAAEAATPPRYQRLLPHQALAFPCQEPARGRLERRRHQALAPAS